VVACDRRLEGKVPRLRFVDPRGREKTLTAIEVVGLNWCESRIGCGTSPAQDAAEAAECRAKPLARCRPAGIVALVEETRDEAEPTGGTDVTAVVGAQEHESEGLFPGASVGRYVVLSKVGAGGMGVVYAAYDPELDRRVALKLVLAKRPAAREVGTTRLQREAQAMAKLAHPNVITVHDVGVFQGQVFIAMEFVEGETLSDWMETERTWSEVVDVFLRAGAGLVAAHEAGLVHRDFKPDNVLMGNDGRVRVMDFGLARAEEDYPSTDTSISSEAPSSEVMTTPLTATGAIMGTPAYMAPEQHLGLQADGRADQFAFCVALYEGIYGERPFAGANRHAIMLAVTEGSIRPAPKGSAVPGWLRAIVLRGLTTSPDGRWPTISQLLEAIENGQAPTTRRWGIWAGLGIVVVGTAALLTQSEPAPGPCAETSQHLEGVWGAREREAVSAAYRDAGLAEAARTTVVEAIDAYAGEWTAMRRDNCESTRISGTQSDQMMDLRTFCLNARRTDLGALIRLLETGEPAALAEASKSIETLAPVSHCADVELLSLRVPVPEDAASRDAVESGEARLAEARARLEAGLYNDVGPILDDIASNELALSHAPFAAEVGELRGRTLVARGEYQSAVSALEQAALDAARGRDDRLLVQLHVHLLEVVGEHLGRTEEGERLDHVARVGLARIGDPKDLDRHRRLVVARLRRVTGKPDESLSLLQALQAELRDEAQADTAFALGVDRSIAALLANLGRYEESDALMKAAVVRLERRFGADHPALVPLLTNAAGMYSQRGEGERAWETLERVVPLAERHLGKNHPETARIYETKALQHHRSREFEKARDDLQRAVDGYLDNYDAGHPSVVRARGNLAATLMELGEFDEAERVSVECRDALVSRFGRDHDYLIFLLSNLAELYIQTERFDEALESILWARSTTEKVFGPDNVRIATSFIIEGNLHVAAGRPDEGITAYERGLEVYARGETPAVSQAHAEAQLAAALMGFPARRAEGKRLFTTAHERALGAGEGGVAMAEVIRSTAAEVGFKL
jgi:tetratricopeptide (TPR) repeat protein/predicted Ser/Thr protein kinase